MKSIDVVLSSKTLTNAVDDFYDHAAMKGLHMGQWALLGQVYREPGKKARVRIAFIPEFWAKQIAAVTARMKANEKRAEKRKAKAKS